MAVAPKSKPSDRKGAVADANIPPHSLEAEQALLGSLMLSADRWDDVLTRIQPSDFYVYAHRLIFEQMIELKRAYRPIDMITVDQALNDRGIQQDVGGLAYLAELSKNTPSASNILAYADIIKERAIRRELIGASNHIAEISYNPKGLSLEGVLEEAEKSIFHISEMRNQTEQGPRSVQDILSLTLEKIENLARNPNHHGVTGLDTGFTALNRITSGLQNSDLIIVAARPAMGKTTFAMNLCENIAQGTYEDPSELDEYGNPVRRQNKTVLIFSLEMPADQIMMRMFASLSLVDQNRLRSGQLEDDDFYRISNTTAMLDRINNIWIDDSSGLTPTELASRARRVHKETGGLSLIMVDYLQLMRAPAFADNRTLEIAEISRSLKALAKELNIPIIALSQLNRNLEQRADKRPVNADLRESGSIEQDADIIMFIYRDEVYNGDASESKGIAEIIIGKHRNGPIGTVKLSYQGRFSRFDNLANYTEYE